MEFGLLLFMANYSICIAFNLLESKKILEIRFNKIIFVYMVASSFFLYHTLLIYTTRI